MPKVEVFLKPHEIQETQSNAKENNLSRFAYIRKAVLFYNEYIDSQGMSEVEEWMKGE